MSKERAHQAWRTAERIKRLSDRLVGIGPFGIGLDAVIDWVPGLGPIYSAGAGGLLVLQGLVAGASPATLLRMIAYLAADTGISAVPLAGWAVDAFFPAHLMAANALQKDIEAKHGPADLPGWGGRRKGRKRGR